MGCNFSLIMSICHSPTAFTVCLSYITCSHLPSHHCPVQWTSLLLSSPPLICPYSAHSFFISLFRSSPSDPSPYICTFFCIFFSFHYCEQTQHSPIAKGHTLVSVFSLAFSSLDSPRLSVGKSSCLFQHVMQRTCPLRKRVHLQAKAFLGSFRFMFY